MGTDKNNDDDIARQRFREALEKALSPIADNVSIVEAKVDTGEACDSFASVAYQQFRSLTNAGFYRNEAVAIVVSMMNGILADCFE